MAVPNVAGGFEEWTKYHCELFPGESKRFFGRNKRSLTPSKAVSFGE
jgi:hypothetical protein